MPAPVTYTKAKDDPLHRLGRVSALVSCERVGQNYASFQVLRDTKQYRAVYIVTRDGPEWEIYPYRRGRRLAKPLRDGPTATIVRLNVEHSRAWYEHSRKLEQ